MFKIFIIMFMFSPDPKGMDSITVETHDNKPLRFETEYKCATYIHTHLEHLKKWAAKEFDYNAVVKSIHCIKDNKDIGV
tara:strand:- start:13147 stop:13383 length:237 start_codon:yes stop_codon:yes gene_type:complete